MKKFKKYVIPILALATIGLFLVSCAQDRQIQSSASYNVPAGSAGTVQNATQLLNDFVSDTGKNIPQSVLDSAAAIALFPGITKAAFIVGGTHGTGVLATHGQNQWSYPVFMSITGGSLGFQAGISSTDLLLVFRDPATVASLKGGNFTLGGDVTVAAGPVGGSVDVSSISAQVLAYRRTQGAFAGVSLSGSKLYMNEQKTLDYYASAAGGDQTVPRGYYNQGEGSAFQDLMNPDQNFGGNVPPNAAELKKTLDQMMSGGSQ